MPNLRLCTIPGCGKPHSARGWCESHYRRWRTFGDRFIDVPPRTPSGALKSFFEAALSYEEDDCLIWPYWTDRKGYAMFDLNGEHTYVSRAVCERTHGAPPSKKHEAAHSCGNGHLGCISKKHLRWATRQENEDDKIVHGTRMIGSMHGQAKLTEDEVREIRKLASNRPGTELAKMFGVSTSAINLILRHKTWVHVT